MGQETLSLRDRLIALQDVSSELLAAHSGLAPSTVRNLKCGANTETDEMRRRLGPVLAGFERGEIPRVAAPEGALTVADVAPRALRAPRVRKVGRDYETELSRRVGTVLDYCAEEAAIGLVAADYGHGKSHAVDAWRRKNSATDVCSLEFVAYNCANKSAFIHELAEVLGVEVRRGGTVAGGRVFRAVVDHLRDEPKLLIFDQAELVRVSVAQVIRQIWDATRDAGTGVALVGALRLVEKLRASRAEDMGALTSRICPWAILPGVGRGEIEQILRAEGIADVDAAAVELLARTVRGSMRVLMHAVRMIHAKHAGKPVREKTIAQIAGHLCGLRINVEGGAA